MLTADLASPTVVVIGNESSGKSTLVGRLAGRVPAAGNLRGSTVAVERTAGHGFAFVDTPGILLDGDSAATALALRALNSDGVAVLLVVRATDLDAELAELLPLVAGRTGMVAVTHWDKVGPGADGRAALDRLALAAGVPFVALDARRPTAGDRAAFRRALAARATFTAPPLRARAGWHVQPPPTVLERPTAGPAVAIALLLAPAVLAVWGANLVAGRAEPHVTAALDPAVEAAAGLPDAVRAVVAGDYGLLTMGPALLVWAGPTVALFAVLFAVYKASGLLDRLTDAVHPLIRPVGLTGRDLVRVLMGYGCNVPAVVSTRSCSACTRDGCLSAIAFGSACSYQLGATLAVFGAAGRPGLAVPYLAYLAATTIAYTRLVSGRRVGRPRRTLVGRGRTFLCRPPAREVAREAGAVLRHFATRAVPVFAVVSAAAALLHHRGALQSAAVLLGPLLEPFRLPAAAALPTVLAAVRKDGILLLAEGGTDGLTAAQLLTATYLASVLLPCLVTVMTIARERSARFAAALVGRQAVAASAFTLLLAAGAPLLLE